MSWLIGIVISLTSALLSHSEIHSLHRIKINLTLRNPPAHHWYAAKSPDLSLQCRSSRALTRRPLCALEAVTSVDHDYIYVITSRNTVSHVRLRFPLSKSCDPTGVATCQKSNDGSNIVTSNMDILLRYIRKIDIGQSSIGDACAAHCVLDDGTNIIMVVVYISPNNKHS
ncbi:ATP-dependent DNA helicase [Trichonephila clavipes]|nr:ATP-dependent DNA helicase [Trichonephila clavipes]